MSIVFEAIQFLTILALAVTGATGTIWDQRDSDTLNQVDQIDLPDQFTTHALQAHADEAWNAVSISRSITGRACGPIVAYWCPKCARVRVICKLNDEQAGQAGFGSTYNGWWAGVTIQKVSGTPTVISAFAASWDYWAGVFRRDGCVPIAWVP